MSVEELRQLKTEVLDATDIVALVGEFVSLRRSGQGFTALCPFHEEKTPSFHVSTRRGTWHCFGRCSTGGNAIDFLMHKEALSYWDALTHLAERANIALPERSRGSRREASERRGIFRANEVAQSFFRTALLKGREAEEARGYVEKRGIDSTHAERFGLGYAPKDGRHLRQVFRKREIPLEAACAAGLLGQREGGGFFDRFRGRLMFPIRDNLGRVVGFGGRALRPDDMPKYKNTPETVVFKKRELIYGLYCAKEAAREKSEIAIVEGYLDVILAHQAGFPWFVATLGTAFGAAHARQLRLLVDNITVFFDGDAAGERANHRGLEELAKAVFRTTRPFESLKVADLPEGMDPADLVVERGPQALAEAIAEARSLVDFLVPMGSRSWPPARKAEALKRAARVLSAFEEAAYREVQLAEVAHRLGVSETVVREEARRARVQAKDEQRKEQAREASRKRSATKRSGAQGAGQQGGKRGTGKRGAGRRGDGRQQGQGGDGQSGRSAPPLGDEPVPYEVPPEAYGGFGDEFGAFEETILELPELPTAVGGSTAAGGSTAVGGLREVSEVGEGAASTRRAHPWFPLPPLDRQALMCLLASAKFVEAGRTALPADWLEDPRAQALAGALYEGASVAAIEPLEVRRLAARLAVGLEEKLDLYERKWEGVLLQIARRRDLERTSNGDDEDSLRGFLDARRRLDKQDRDA